jgi:hypothetical protein
VQIFTNLVTLPDLHLFVIGGYTHDDQVQDVELISLDERNNPLPTRLQKLKKFPEPFLCGAGGRLNTGECQI